MDGNVSLSSGEFASVSQLYNISVFPNPVRDQLNIGQTTKDVSRIYCEIDDLPEKNVFASSYMPVSEGDQSIQVAIPTITSGYYILKLTQNQKVIGVQKLIVSF